MTQPDLPPVPPAPPPAAATTAPELSPAQFEILARQMQAAILASQTTAAATAAAAEAPPEPDGVAPVRARTDGNGLPLLDVPRKQVMTEQIGEEPEIPVWDERHESSPPKGSTAESLLIYERGVPVRVAGPTHYHQLADGRVLGGYSGGTHHDDGTKITRVIGIHEG
jgi:hypothetical protein